MVFEDVRFENDSWAGIYIGRSGTWCLRMWGLKQNSLSKPEGVRTSHLKLMRAMGFKHSILKPLVPKRHVPGHPTVVLALPRGRQVIIVVMMIVNILIVIITIVILMMMMMITMMMIIIIIIMMMMMIIIITIIIMIMRLSGSSWRSANSMPPSRCCAPCAWQPRGAVSTPNLPTKSLDFRGFDSSRLLILRGGNSHVRRI